MAPILLTNNIYKWYSNPAAEAYWFFELTRKYFLEKFEKPLTDGKTCGIINELLLRTKQPQTNLENQRLNSM